MSARTAALGFAAVLAATASPGAAPADASEVRTTVSGWGGFDVGQSVIPASLDGQDVRSISAGDEHSLALTTDGVVVGWGWNGEGQATPPADLATGTTRAWSIDAGVYASLALLPDGSVRGWGALGDTDEGQVDIPADLQGPDPRTPARSVSTGTYHSLAVTRTGQVVAWGAEGRHAAINAGQTHVPLALRDGSRHVVDVAAGYLHSLAVDDLGRVTAWGSDRHGALQIPSRVSQAVVVDVEAHGATSMALTAEGEVIAWGDTGTGTATLPPALADARVVAIDLGAEVAMALTSTGSIITWGNAGRDHPVPADVGQHAPFGTIAAGGRHLLATHLAPPPPPVVEPPAVTSPVVTPPVVTPPVVAPPGTAPVFTTLTMTAPRRAVAGTAFTVRVALGGATAGPVVIRDKGRRIAGRTGTGTVRLRLTKGRHVLVATYAGSSTASACTSAPVTVKVAPRKRR